MILSVDDSFSNRVDQSTFEFDVLFVCISIIVFQFVHCDVIIPFVWKVVLLLLMTHWNNCFPDHFYSTDLTSFLERNTQLIEI